jgi:hypothetical protein
MDEGDDSHVSAGIPLQGIVALYASERGARTALSGFWRDARPRRWSGELVALCRPHGGSLRNDTPHLAPTSAAAAAGGLVGLSVGLITGPIGWLALAGSLAGGAVSRFRGVGAVDPPLRVVGERLTPGSSALVAVVLREQVREVERWLAQGGADLITDLLPARTLAELAARVRHPRSV